MAEESKQQVKTEYSVAPYGILDGHSGWVTKICTSTDPDTLITTSRDKSILIWKLFNDGPEIDGKIKLMLTGHNHFISDCAVSKDGGFIITSSWDRTMRLWDINRGLTKRIFNGHTNDVMSVSFSHDNRQIVSGSRDCTVRLWNTVAVQKYVFEDEGHRDCVSAVLTRSIGNSTMIISAGWDRVVKVWSLKPPSCSSTIYGHQNAINSLSTCPNNRLLASGSKDGTINVWLLSERTLFHKYAAGGDVSAVSFNPAYRVLAAAVGQAVNLYDLASHDLIRSLTPIDTENSKAKPLATSLTWSNDGHFLFAGYSDGKVRVYCVNKQGDSNAV